MRGLLQNTDLLCRRCTIHFCWLGALRNVARCSNSDDCRKSQEGAHNDSEVSRKFRDHRRCRLLVLSTVLTYESVINLCRIAFAASSSIGGGGGLVEVVDIDKGLYERWKKIPPPSKKTCF